MASRKVPDGPGQVGPPGPRHKPPTGPGHPTPTVAIGAVTGGMTDAKAKTVLKEAVDAVVNSFAKHTHGYGRGKEILYKQTSFNLIIRLMWSLNCLEWFKYTTT